MMTKFQCGYCLNALKMPSNLVGRKILCPMCTEPIVIPEPDPNRLFKKQNISQAIEKFKLTDWDRAFARTIHTDKILSDKDLLLSIAGTIKACKKGPEVSLGEYLYNQKLITAEQRKEIREKQRGNVGKEKEEFIECPNCFATVASSLRACKYCGQKLGAEASVEVCPGCKNEQPRGLGRCRRCMADMKTGLRPTSQRCPKCGELVLGSQSSCPKCQSALSRPGARQHSRKSGISKGALAGTTAAAIVMIILAIIFGGSIFESKETKQLKNSITKLSAILEENATDQIKLCSDPEVDLKISPELPGYVISGNKQEKIIKKIKEITPLEITISKDKKTAQVKMKISVVMVDKSYAQDDMGLNRLFQGETKEFQPVWKWRYVENRWLLTDPLPVINED